MPRFLSAVAPIQIRRRRLSKNNEPSCEGSFAFYFLYAC